ncbi:RusA family crossover junction endodeoxyribonuclease [Arthrobacter sp. Bi26]|uniref:RusA family crossover junction endodeoxyribonuclease n=1 Tax=Arthrobacter sp. Bi26 TaxID=2822350 RepID=UPI001E454EDC|nr:RusA family crossover junction endodeoxyribonuclease [Arthrobacter sp. Bi26]
MADQDPGIDHGPPRRATYGRAPSVSLVFQLVPPKKPRSWAPAVKPDLDKLIRAVLDSLSTTKNRKTKAVIKGVITDDARIIEITAAKTYHGNPGVLITITHAGENK